ncbi:hypothetical protein, partial [Microbispora sp. H10949]|uniref:hypothetical protein n=1 Tax=Microbispora sp. H10949 TaxID=2729111 RepID=UPI001603AA51
MLKGGRKGPPRWERVSTLLSACGKYLKNNGVDNPEAVLGTHDEWLARHSELVRQYRAEVKNASTTRVRLVEPVETVVPEVVVPETMVVDAVVPEPRANGDAVVVETVVPEVVVP